MIMINIILPPVTLNSVGNHHKQLSLVCLQEVRSNM